MSKAPVALAFVYLRNLFSGVPQTFVDVLYCAITAGGEQLWETLTLFRPKDKCLARRQALLNFIGPPLTLFLITLAWNTKSYRKVRQHVVRQQDDANNESQLDVNAASQCSQPMQQASAASIHCIHNYWAVFTIVYRSFLIPGIWFVAALIDADYIVCIFYEGPEDSIPPEQSTISYSTEQNTISYPNTELNTSVPVTSIEQIQADSRLMAWILIFIIAGLWAIAMLIIYCCLDDSLLSRIHYQETYDRKFEEKAKEIAATDAVKDAESFADKFFKDNQHKVPMKYPDDNPNKSRVFFIRCWRYTNTCHREDKPPPSQPKDSHLDVNKPKSSESPPQSESAPFLADCKLTDQHDKK